MADNKDVSNLYIGSLVGLAVGDALGTTLEFCSPGTFAPLQDMVGGGPFHLAAGQWTDDTSMALCLAESLVRYNGFNPKDQMDLYIKWYKDGYVSSTGSCFDIGTTTELALKKYMKTGIPFSGSTDVTSAGNGSIMRLAPVALYFAGDAEQATIYCAKSSKTTHGALECLDACRLLGALIVGAVRKVSKDELLAPFYHPDAGYWNKKPLAPQIADIAAGCYKMKEPPAIQGSGYVVKSLEAALWAFYKTESFEAGALLAVNLGDDADTTGAVYGQLAGSYYGVDAIPITWRNKISRYEHIVKLAEKLYCQSQSVKNWFDRWDDFILYDRCVIANDRSFHLYLSDTYDHGRVFKFEVFDANGKSLDKTSMSTGYLGANDYHMIVTATMISKRYPEIKNYFKELHEVAGWKEWTPPGKLR